MWRSAVVALVVLGSRAADADPTAAKRLFDEGRALLAQGKHLEACVLFEKSYELDPAVGTQLNLGECAERDGKLRNAWLLYSKASDEYERTGRSGPAKIAHDLADALAPKLATVVIHVAKPRQTGLVIRIGGRDLVPARELVERLDAGQITVTAIAPDRQAFTATVEGVTGREVEVDVPALKRVGTTEPEPDEPIRPDSKRWRTVAYVGGAATLVFAGSFLYTYSQLSDTDFGQKCIDDGMGHITGPGICPSGPTYRAVAIASELGLVVSTGLTIVAIYKLVTAKPKTNELARAFRVTPLVARGGGGALLRFDW